MRIYENVTRAIIEAMTAMLSGGWEMFPIVTAAIGVRRVSWVLTQVPSPNAFRNRGRLGRRTRLYLSVV